MVLPLISCMNPVKRGGPAVVEFESGFFVVAVMVAVGMVCSFLYDLLRALQKPLHPRGTVAFLGDLLFWLLAACLVSAAVLLVAGGELRLIFVMGAVLGAFLYFAGLSPWLFPPMCAVVMGLHRAFVGAIERVRYVLGLPVRGVEAAFKVMAGVVEPVTGRLSLAGLFSGTGKNE